MHGEDAAVLPSDVPVSLDGDELVRVEIGDITAVCAERKVVGTRREGVTAYVEGSRQVMLHRDRLATVGHSGVELGPSSSSAVEVLLMSVAGWS